jgi:hypothetical protein
VGPHQGTDIAVRRQLGLPGLGPHILYGRARGNLDHHAFTSSPPTWRACDLLSQRVIPQVRPCPTAAFRTLPGLDHDLDGSNHVPVKVLKILKILGRGPVLEDSLPAS